jgi:hypothetical protein
VIHGLTGTRSLVITFGYISTDEYVSNHIAYSEFVIVERDTECIVRRRIDETQSILLSFDKVLCLRIASCASLDVRSVDQDSVGIRRWPSSLKIIVCQQTLLPGCSVIPISEDVRSQIIIIVGRCRAVDHNRSESTITVLRAEVRMVPGRAELGGLEGICFGVSRSKWAFCDPRDTSLRARSELSDTVPVYACAVVLDRVLEGYLDHIAPVYVNISIQLHTEYCKDAWFPYLPAYSVGPGYWPLIFTHGLESEPSGLHVLL